jgi:molybdopterin-guanine dinucleotide biosynthesis protein A
MGGTPKGLLRLDDGRALIERTLSVVAEAGLRTVLVGNRADYDTLTQLPRIQDVAGVEGPLAGLIALLRHVGDDDAIALACDMPYLTPGLLTRLATEAPTAVVLAPRSPGSIKWEPLCARYRAHEVLSVLERAVAAGERSFQRVLAQLDVVELTLSSVEQRCLIDWDSPADRQR